MKKQPPTPTAFDADVETEQLLVDYLRHTGGLIPQTPEEVAHAEARIKSEGGEAPARLRNRKVTCGVPARGLKFPPVSSSTETLQYFARAAREGKQISDKVEAQMRQDREQAKREVEGDK